MPSPMHRMTAEDAARALYIDFEGQTDRVPVLLGTARKSKGDAAHIVTHVITDSAFAPIAAADGLEVRDLPDAVEHILQRAESKRRRIVAWSQHELDIVARHCPDKLDRFQSRYVNARAVAEYWRNARHDCDRPEVQSLAAYLGIVGYAVPEDAAGPDKVGRTISAIRSSLERGRTVDQLTDLQRERWAILREHNRHDCIGMRRVCLVATRELETPVPARHARSGRKARRRLRLAVAAG